MFKIGSGPTNSECFSHTPEGGTVSNFFSLVAPVDSRIWKLVTTLRPLKLEEIHEGLTSVLYDIFAVVYLRLGGTVRPHEFKSLGQSSPSNCDTFNLNYVVGRNAFSMKLHSVKFGNTDFGTTRYFPSRFFICLCVTCQTISHIILLTLRDLDYETGKLLLCYAYFFGVPTALEMHKLEFSSEISTRLEAQGLCNVEDFRHVGIEMFEGLQLEVIFSLAYKLSLHVA